MRNINHYPLDFFVKYEEKLKELLLDQATKSGILNGQLLEAEELDLKWKEMAPEYMADAVPEIARYPMVSIAWAGYLGLALGHFWDKDWISYQSRTDLYQSLRNPRGFDAMDEHIVEDVLGLTLDSYPYKKLEEALQSLSDTALTLIRRENINAQTTDAFHIYSHTVKVMFKLGVAIELRRLGYNYVKSKI